MSFANNKAIVAQFVEEILNRGNYDEIKNLVSPNIVWHGQYKKVKSSKSLKKWLSVERNIFPEMQFRIVENLAEHDKVAIRWVLQAKLKEKSSSRQKLQVMGMSIFQFEDNKIKEAWIAFDTLNPALQIGVVDVVPSMVQKVKKHVLL